MAVDFATCGRIRPTIAQIRKRMGILEGATTLASRERALESYDDEARKVGLRPLRYGLRDKQAWEWVAHAIEQGSAIDLAIDYGVINRRRPELSGDKVFRGNHSLLVKGPVRAIDGSEHVLVFDPLADGRRPDIPRGRQWWPVRLLRVAAAAYAGDGLASGGVVKRAEAIAGQVPPTGTEELLARIDELEAALGVARTALVNIIASERDLVEAAIGDIDAVLPAPPDHGQVALPGIPEDDR